MATEWLGLAEVATRARAERTVARTASGPFDHAALRARIAQWRDALAAREGVRWALHFEEITDFAAALYGAWHAGKEVVLCSDVLPETLTRLAQGVHGLAGDFPPRCDALALHREPPPDRATPSSDRTWPALDRQATRLEIHTSGSTGEPAAIGKALFQLDHEVAALEHAFGAQVDGATVLGTVSHQHIYGLLFRVLWPLAAGRPIASRGFFHEALLAAMEGPTVLVTSPAHLKRLPEGLDWAHARKHLRAVFSSGGALDAESAAQAALRLGQAPIEVYGSSETGGVAWRRSDGSGAAWTPLRGVRWRSHEGHLEVASPHLPDGAWHRTADLVEPDPHGGFRLCGRADRIVKVEERRVSLTALEHALASHPAVAEARVVLLQGARIELGGVIVPSAEGIRRLAAEGRRALLRELGQHLASRQDAVTRPRRWRLVDALPVDAQGKNPQARLLALFRPPRPEPTWLARGKESAELEVELDPALAVFDGHFPQFPILPGVAQLDWAIRFGREAFALPPRVIRLESLKFQQVALPGERVRFQLQWRGDSRTLGFRIESARGTHASGRVLFEGGEA